MPKTRSARKAMRQNARRRARNVAKRIAIRAAKKKFREALAAKNADAAAEALRTLYKLLDKAAKTGVLHKNAAARTKSRFAAKLAMISKR